MSEQWPTGYGEAGRRAVRALAAAGVPVRWVPLGWHETLVRVPVAYVIGSIAAFWTVQRVVGFWG